MDKTANRTAGILVGFVAVTAITLFRGSIDWLLGNEMPLLFYVLAVLLAARVGGALPGLVTTALSVVAGVVFIIGPRAAVASDAEWLRIAIFVLEGALISWIVHELRRRTTELTKTAEDLVSERNQMERLSLEDKLTGLGNRRAFEHDVRKELARCRRENCSLTIVTADINGLKRTNDEQGHEAGDGLIMASAVALSSATRATDSAYRIGGDEFALLMRDTNGSEYSTIMPRLAEAVDHATAGFPGTGLSLGASHAPEEGADLPVLLRVVDARMYSVKAAVHDGRDIKQALREEREEEALPSGRRPSIAEQRSYLDLVRMLAAAVDARDAYTQSHSLVVAELVAELYDYLKLPRSGRLSMRTAAMLHDVGKIGIPDSILRKPAPLSSSERKEIELHPVLACDILHAIPRPEILPWIRGHHERWDGQGYPDGLAGHEIPFESRMIAVCDAYDAITADRPYHGTRSADEGIDQIQAGRGTQFDPQLADAFLEMMEARRELALH